MGWMKTWKGRRFVRWITQSFQSCLYFIYFPSWWVFPAVSWVNSALKLIIQDRVNIGICYTMPARAKFIWYCGHSTGNARVAGLQKDLKMTDAQYQICLAVFFVWVNVYPVVIFWLRTFFFSPYIASELPSNLMLRKIGPSILMPTLLTVWGVIVTLQGRSPTSELIRWIWFTETLGFIGLVTSFRGLVIVRLLLGLVEGPMAPCIVCYLSGFYIRKELSLRFASSHPSDCLCVYVNNSASRIAFFFSAASVRTES